MNTRQASAAKPRPRIGFLFDSLWDDFEAKVWRGVVDEARAQEVNLVCFAGGALRSPISVHRNREVLHEMIGPANIDGLLVLAGCLGTFITFEETRQYIERFASVPMLSLSTLFEDIPSLIVDNRSGMSDLVTHFITVHRCRRIAFVCGPAGNFDADERLAAYKQALMSHGIPIDPALIVQGNFMYGSGELAVHTLLNERRVEFDALIAANDHMAVDALNALQRLGVSVPGKVLLGGFDDMKDSQASIPSLTTVHQPTYEIGRRAVRDMRHWLESGEPAQTTRLPTRLVTRASCGCLTAASPSYLHAVNGTTIRDPVRDDRPEQAIPMLAQVLGQRFAAVTDMFESDAWARRLVEAYVAEHRGEEGALCVALAAVMDEGRAKPLGSGTWGEVLHFFLTLMDRWLPCQTKVRDAAFLLVHQHVEAVQTAAWLDYEMQTAALQVFQQPISASFELQKLSDIVCDALPNVGIHGFALSLYENGPHGRAVSYLALQYERRTASDQFVQTFDPNTAPRFPSAELVPGAFRDRQAAYQVNVFPVSFEQEHFGFALYEIGNVNANLYEIVNSHLISLTKGMRLLEETKNYTHKLENDVAARTAELRLANEMLQKANALMLEKNREIEKLNEELMEKSKLDGLTNIYNRRAFLEMLKTEVQRAQRAQRREQQAAARRAQGERRASAGRSFALIMFDLDHFKTVNDTYGHLVGDEVLRRVGALLRDTDVLRQVDTPGRFGGEEFIVLLPDTDAESAYAPAERLAERLRDIAFSGRDGATFGVTVSIGISQYNPDDPHEEAVIQRADHALYYAKNHGRNRIVVFERLSPAQQRDAKASSSG